MDRVTVDEFELPPQRRGVPDGRIEFRANNHHASEHIHIYMKQPRIGEPYSFGRIIRIVFNASVTFALEVIDTALRDTVQKTIHEVEVVPDVGAYAPGSTLRFRIDFGRKMC